MRVFAALLVVLICTTAVEADVSIDIKAKDPVAKLPLIAANKENFLRSYRRWRKGCKKPDIWVESGGIESAVDEPQYSTFQLRGGCTEAIDEFAGNVGVINTSMKDTKCATAAPLGRQYAKLPASIVADGMKLDITANAQSVHVMVNKLGAVGTLAGTRRMATKFAATDVHGWYIVETNGMRQVSVLLYGKEADGTFVEKWMEVWTKKVAAPAPIDVARNWLLAVATKDAATVAATTAPAFQRVGFEPMTGALVEGCKKTRASKKAAELQPVLDCVLAESPARYASLYDANGFTKIAPNKAPAELKPHAKIVAALAGGGATLFSFESDDEKGATAVVIAVAGGKVTGAVEVQTLKVVAPAVPAKTPVTPAKTPVVTPPAKPPAVTPPAKPPAVTPPAKPPAVTPPAKPPAKT